MKNLVLKVHPKDNVIVALQNFAEGDSVDFNGKTFLLKEAIPTKHKFAEYDFSRGDTITMYGVIVGKALTDIPEGTRISTENVAHSSGAYEIGERRTDWHAPDISAFERRTFLGFYRPDGKSRDPQLLACDPSGLL